MERGGPVVTRLVSREEAGLRPPKSVSHSITPAHLTGHYAGPSPWGAGGIGDHNRCATIWRGYQAFHMNTRGWSDIAYTSGVCPHGDVFEGRGPGVRTAANGTDRGNQMSYATCYIGGAGDPLTDEAKFAYLVEALRLGEPLDRGHRDWKATACPGDPLYEWIHAGAPMPGEMPAAPPQVDVPPPGAGDFGALLELIRQAKRRTFRRGDRGDGVKLIQKAINDLAGRGLAVDGVFGPGTEQAVKDLQRWVHLGVDGIVGPQTWAVLYPNI